jgi:hypothetical protein
MEEVFRSTDPVELSLAMALLSGENIGAVCVDVHMSVLEGSIGILPQRILVAGENSFLARNIVGDNGLVPSQCT